MGNKQVERAYAPIATASSADQWCLWVADNVETCCFVQRTTQYGTDQTRVDIGLKNLWSSMQQKVKQRVASIQSQQLIPLRQQITSGI